jgi:aspartate/methionine/tyrosine aminotransferase
MDDIKLQKVILGPDWIDLSFGEPHVVMEALHAQLNRVSASFKMPDIFEMKQWTYQPANGTPELTKLLEEKYDAKVVVTNGAKQALAATLYSFKQRGVNSIHFDSPYYPANPSLVKSAGLIRAPYAEADSYLITTPNNPDGKLTHIPKIIECRAKAPTIHDAAYYTNIYLPEGEQTIPLGHVQVFSASKMYGLSGLRIGYAVCHNEDYYKDIVNFIELNTAGVSAPSQELMLRVETFFKKNPKYYDEFVKEARFSIKGSREELKNLDPEVLTVEPCDSNSMFAWCKIGPKLNYKAAKVHILEGTLFGKPGYMRINIAHSHLVIREAVKRLNEHKI